MAVYGASKAFVHSFSQALHEEQRAMGVWVQTFVPAPTATEFDQVSGLDASLLGSRSEPADAVRASLAALEKGAVIASNAPRLWAQRLFAAVFSPRFVLGKVAAMMSPHAYKAFANDDGRR